MTYSPDHNPHLVPWKHAEPSQAGGKGEIERPGTAANVPYQTRAAAPTDYENGLGDALQTIFGDGVEDLPEVVSRLNDAGIRDPHGGLWTEESFQREMKRLGG